MRRSALWLLAITTLYLFITLAQVVLAGRQKPPAEADAVVVLGAAQYDGRPSPQLEGRLITAIDLWLDGARYVYRDGWQPGG